MLRWVLSSCFQKLYPWHGGAESPLMWGFPKISLEGELKAIKNTTCLVGAPRHVPLSRSEDEAQSPKELRPGSAEMVAMAACWAIKHRLVENAIGFIDTVYIALNANDFPCDDDHCITWLTVSDKLCFNHGLVFTMVCTQIERNTMSIPPRYTKKHQKATNRSTIWTPSISVRLECPNNTNYH